MKSVYRCILPFVLFSTSVYGIHIHSENINVITGEKSSVSYVPPLLSYVAHVLWERDAVRDAQIQQELDSGWQCIDGVKLDMRGSKLYGAFGVVTHSSLFNVQCVKTYISKNSSDVYQAGELSNSPFTIVDWANIFTTVCNYTSSYGSVISTRPVLYVDVHNRRIEMAFSLSAVEHSTLSPSYRHVLVSAMHAISRGQQSVFSSHQYAHANVFERMPSLIDEYSDRSLPCRPSGVSLQYNERLRVFEEARLLFTVRNPPEETEMLKKIGKSFKRNTLNLGYILSRTFLGGFFSETIRQKKDETARELDRLHLLYIVEFMRNKTLSLHIEEDALRVFPLLGNMELEVPLRGKRKSVRMRAGPKSQILSNAWNRILFDTVHPIVDMHTRGIIASVHDIRVPGFTDNDAVSLFVNESTTCKGKKKPGLHVNWKGGFPTKDGKMDLKVMADNVWNDRRSFVRLESNTFKEDNIIEDTGTGVMRMAAVSMIGTDLFLGTDTEDRKDVAYIDVRVMNGFMDNAKYQMAIAMHRAMEFPVEHVLEKSDLPFNDLKEVSKSVFKGLWDELVKD